MAFTNSLFPTETFLPKGFVYRPDFLSSEEEARLIEVVKRLDLRPMIFQGFEAKRRVQSFGYDYSFDNRRLSKGKDIPDDFDWLMLRVAKECGVDKEKFSEVLVTEYPPGSVINWHRDAPPFEVIVGISLLSDCVFKLRPHDKLKQTRKSVVSLPVSRRSLYIIDGESRSAWQHSIAPVKELRYSVTLRTLKGA